MNLRQNKKSVNVMAGFKKPNDLALTVSGLVSVLLSAAPIPFESPRKGSSLLFAVFINDIDIPANTEMLYPHLQVWIGILEIT